MRAQNQASTAITMTDCQTLPADRCLAFEDVHVWWASLCPSPRDTAFWMTYLSADERDRADRYRFARDRIRFIVGRGLLRMLISRYLDLAPRQAQFAYGPYGKPSLAGAGDDLTFSLAHSDDLAVYAFSRKRDIGVDLEYVRPLEDMRDIAARFFSPDEAAALAALPQPQQLDAFYHIWTCKEAYLKALGAGLSLPLDAFDVAVNPQNPARLLRVGLDRSDEPGRWTLLRLASPDHYAAALSVNGPVARVVCRASDVTHRLTDLVRD
jgi:4'-phosphopantetheinyl transferase